MKNWYKHNPPAGRDPQSEYALVPNANAPPSPYVNQDVLNTQASVVVVQASPSYSSNDREMIPLAPPPYSNRKFNGLRLWLDRFTRCEDRTLFQLCLIEALLAVVILGGGIWCVRDASDYCPYYSEIWSSAVFLLSAVVGCVAAKLGTINFYVAHLVLSLISIAICIVSAGLSAWNWTLIGTYNHPRIDRSEAFCLQGEHDALRLSHISKYMEQYDFQQCLFQLKLGIAVNSVQFVVASIEALLMMISAVFCCKRTCTRCISKN